ncbi:hypothetical protein Riv7116_6321 [Rivularia sp. PCC 7116]|uniref:calcium-binding protein n=1 Tax=Rivularia sp. PCC 7116 TaxID=373994 RepID=UPI00029ED88B|nr:hypothetical protein [Rivularia sp. PCC 7116]AFY58664.1 hypothetical protein Riv7116_6321 [Rivularia sp. PCC 7116]
MSQDSNLPVNSIPLIFGEVFSYVELPVVNFSVDRTVIVEGGEAQLITFNLSEPAPAGGLAIKLRIDDPDGEPGDTDNALELFSNVTDSNNRVENGIFVANITIASGATEATIGIKALTDNKVEGDETYSLTLLDNDNYIVDSASTTITTTIEDFMKPTVSLKIESETVVEDGQAKLIFTLSEPAPNGGLVVNFNVEDSDPGFDEFIFNPEASSNIVEFKNLFQEGDTVAPQIITIAEGATEAILVQDIPDDGILESPETLTYTLDMGEGYKIDSEDNAASFTLVDKSNELPIVSLSPEILIATEGNSLVRNITLDRPVPEGGLTVNLVVTQNTESTIGELNINQEASTGITDSNGLIVDGVALGVTVTLAEGITEALLVADTVADDIPETDEIITLSLADGEDYRANPDQNNLFTVFTDRTVVTLTTDRVNVAEGDTFAWNFSLNQPAPEGGLTLSLPITLNNDPAPGDVIYNVEGSTNIEDFGFITENDVSIGFTLTIPEGETVATLVSQAVVDDVAEFDEIFTTVLADGNDYVANPVSNQVVTTIAEDGVAPPSSAPVVSITPSALISTEGDTFAWDFSLDKPVPSGGLTLSLPITQNNDPAPGDVIYNVEGSTGITDFDFIVEDDISIGFSVTLAEGITQATLVSETVDDDDDLDDSADEIFTTVLADGVDYRANPDSNEVVTVLTREPVVSFTPEQVNVAEGDTFAWNFSLNQPAPEGGLTLSLPITFNNDPEPGDVDYNVEGSTNITDFSFLVVDNVSLGFNVTIAEGATEATLVSQAVADDLEEIDEIFTTILADGANYRANPVSREVVTTIVEQDSSSSTPVVSVTAEPTIFTENGGMGSFVITLSQPAPEEGLKIKFEAVDQDGMQGDSEVALENISDIEIITEGDSPSFIVVEPGATEAKLMFTGIPDGVAEGEELSGFTILEGEGYTIDSNQSSANIIVTDLPIVSLNTEPTNVNEGEQLKFNFEFSEVAPTGGLTVNLDLVEDTDPLPGDITYFVEGSENITDFELLVNESTGLIDGATVTIAEGATSATLLNDIIADNNTEGPESVKFGLASGDYSIDSDENAASFTIVDTSVGGKANVHNAVVNPSFEIPQLPENQFTQTSLGEFIPGWKVFDPDALIGENITDVGAYNPIPNVFASEAPEGENTAYAYSQAPIGSGIFGLTQTLDTQLKANTKYSLQVEVGNAAENNPDDGFNYEGFPGYRVELLAGGKVLARDDNSLSIAEGVFETSTVNFTATETEAFLGQDLGIRLVNLLADSGEDVEFDNVKLFAETVEPVLTTLSLNAQPTNVNEGEQLKFNFELTEAAPTGGLTVNLDLVEDTDPLPGDITYFVEGSENITDFELLVNESTGLIDGATVTIAEGAKSATLLNDIIADNNTEGPESVKFGLASGDYSIDSNDNAASFTIVDTSVANEISGTTQDDNLYGTNAAEIISGVRGDDNISGNGGGDTLIGGRGDDDIYGSFEADKISGGRGDDYIFGNGGNDLIDSGMGFDTVFLGAGEATVILDKGAGFDTIFNFQLGATKLEVSSLDNLNFTDGDSGTEIFQEGDKLAVVAGQSANTFSSNQDMIFAV